MIFKILILLIIIPLFKLNEIEEENKNFDLEDPVPEEFYASDDNDDSKSEESNLSNVNT